MSTDTTWFRSKVDAWLGVVLALALGAELVATVAAVVAGELATAAALAGGLLFVAALLALVGLPVRYGIGPDTLIVRHGVMVHTIPLARIRAVTPSRNPLSAPALSLDRLRIDLDGGEAALISPDDRARFLALLAARAGLAARGDGLVRG